LNPLPASSRSKAVRRLLAPLTTAVLVTALVVGVGVAQSPARAASGSSPVPRATVPPTVSRTMPLSARALAGRAAGASVRGGELSTQRAIRARPQELCPGFRFTAVGLVWHQDGGGEVLARIRTSDQGSSFGSPSLVRSEPDEGPSPGSPDYHPHRQAAGLLWTGPRRCARVSLRLPAGIAVSRVRAA